MSPKSPARKTLAVVLGLTVFAASLVPVSGALAHDRHKNGWKGHGGHHHHGHGYRKHKRNNKGDLIAAGIIGLAIGAIIAGESAKRNRRSADYPYSGPYGDRYDDPYVDPHYDGSVTLEEYNRRGRASEPQVITFNDPASLEPWTPGWHEWCSQNYRSFNPQRGTFRGYDGLDHFCVPK